MDDDTAARQKQMVDYLVGSGFLKTPGIIEAFRAVPRHFFVPPTHKKFAYDDIALPLIKESTVSQPSTVATMLELLQPKSGEKVLEIGTGSGWQTCIIARCLAPKGGIVTVEIDPDVVNIAKENIKRRQLANIKIIYGDGSGGYHAEAPYEKIIYNAAVPEVPRQALMQLKNGGRLIAPVGKRVQELYSIQKISDSKTEETKHGSFSFVPLRGEFGV